MTKKEVVAQINFFKAIIEIAEARLRLAEARSELAEFIRDESYLASKRKD